MTPEPNGLVAQISSLRETPSGIALEVKVSPGAKRDAVLGTWNGMLKIAVAAAPERGKANEAVIALLAEVFGVRSADVQITRGATGTRKQVALRGLRLRAAAQSIAARLRNAER